MEIEYTVIQRGGNYFVAEELHQAVRELIPHLTGLPLSDSVLYNLLDVVKKAAICTAWNVDKERLLQAQEAFHAKNRTSPFLAHRPFRRHKAEGVITPVGIAFLYDCSRPWKKEGKIEDVVVHPEYRGKGIGKQLIQNLLAQDGLPPDSQYSVITLTSRPSREAANALYTKLDFERVETNVYRLKRAS